MALFDDTQVVIFNKETKEILMRGSRNTLTGPYMLDLKQKIKQPKIMTELEISDTFFANHVYECRPKHNLAIYYHLTLFSPPVSTWVKAIKTNYLSTWPGLTADLVPRYLPKSEYTSYGHLRQHHKGTWSTKTRQSTTFISVPQVEPYPDVIESIFPESSDSEITDEIYLKIYDM